MIPTEMQVRDLLDEDMKHISVEVATKESVGMFPTLVFAALLPGDVGLRLMMKTSAYYRIAVEYIIVPHESLDGKGLTGCLRGLQDQLRRTVEIFAPEKSQQNSCVSR